MWPILEYSTSNQPSLRSMSSLGGRVLSAGESVDVLQPCDDTGEPLHIGVAGSLGDRFNAARDRIGVQICYCSTLGDCWTLRAQPPQAPIILETRGSPAPSANSFRE